MSDQFEFGDFRLDAVGRLLYRGGELVPLTPKAAETLVMLVRHNGQVVTKQELMESVWAGTFVEDNTLTQNISILRKTLGSSADGKSAIETIPRRGYRFTVTVRPPGEQLAPSQPPRRSRRLAVVVGALLVLSGVLFAWWWGRGSQPAHAGRKSVAVLGFQNLSGKPESGWLSTALSEMLTTELAAGEHLRTVPGESVARMRKELSLAPAESYGHETLATIHRNLGADLVVVGTYLPIGGKVRLDLRLQDTNSGETLDAVSQTDDEGNLLALVANTGTHLREKLGIEALSAAQRDSVRKSVAAGTDAERLYAEGLGRLRASDPAGAEPLLARAAAADPQYPLAHSALAAAWSLLGYDRKARDEDHRALELSASLPREDKLAIEGRYRQSMGEWDKAMAIYQTLWTLFPDNVEYGLLLANARTLGGKAKDALAVIPALRKLRAPVKNDPRIDLAESAARQALSDYRAALDRAREAGQRSATLGTRFLQARASLQEGAVQFALGDPAKALAAYRRAEQISGSLQDRAAAAAALTAEAELARSQGDLTQAKAVLEKALAAGREIGDRRTTAASLTSLAELNRNQANMTEARALFEEALAIYRETGDAARTTVVLANLGNILNNTGHPEESKKLYREALALAQETGNRRETARSTKALAILAYTEGDLAGARKSLEGVLEEERRMGAKSSYAYTLGHLATILEYQGDLGGARKLWNEQCGIQKKVGEKIRLANCEASLAELSIEEGHPEAAETLCLRIAREFQTTNPAGDAWRLLALSYLARGDIGKAREAADRALEFAAKTLNAADFKIPIGIAAARVEAAGGKTTEAVAALDRLLAQSRELHLAGMQIEAGLALAEADARRGDKQAGRNRARAVEQEAQRMGFGLAAAKARKMQNR